MMTRTCLIGVRVLPSFAPLCDTAPVDASAETASAADDVAVAPGVPGAALHAATVTSDVPAKSPNDVRLRIFIASCVAHGSTNSVTNAQPRPVIHVTNCRL
jgi:hypothetical protein